MNYLIAEIIEIINGTTTKPYKEVNITNICIDTRQVIHPAASLFFCLIARNDGHQYITTAYEKGIRFFVTSEKVEIDKFPDATFISVKHTTKALQQLAKFHREQFKIPVVGITGSNGKTIVKEWLYQLLSPDMNIVKSPKSYNSQIGVPLSVLNITPENELAIFEAGISTTAEMHVLQQIIQPTIGIFTNIGSAHDAGFSSKEEKVNEKLQLFSECEKIIYSSSYKTIQQAVANNPSFISFGFFKTDKYFLSDKIILQNKTQININKYKFDIPFNDEASVENCLHCIILLKELGYTDDIIQQKIQTLRNLPMRLELKYGINNCTIVDDSYSADFHSLQIALDFLKQQESQKKKTLIISEFNESGLTTLAFVQKLKSVLQHNHFDKLIGIGNAFLQHIEMLSSSIKEWYVFGSTEEFSTQFNLLKFENEIILIKGARAFGFEKISALLIGQTHATVLEVNLNALINNLNIYKSYLPKTTGVIAMVKAFSYGSGSTEVASLLEKQQVSYLAVAYADEGVQLRKEDINLPIMVMNPDAVDFDRMIAYNLEPEIYSIHILTQLINKVAGKNVHIHLKIETGMNRLGFAEDEISELLLILNQHKNIVVKTVFSHLAASEDVALEEFTHQQIKIFERISTKIRTAFSYPIKRHILNSGGILRFPNAHYDFVRLGIGLYGVDSAAMIQEKLIPIGKLKTRVAQIKLVPKGHTVGYSRKGIADRDLKIGILAIGYADGYDRRMGNGIGEVFIAGQRARIIGNVCMDMCMVDITEIDNVNEGDECEIYGKEISIIAAAKNIGTIPYELLTRISARVKRLYYLD